MQVRRVTTAVLAAVALPLVVTGTAAAASQLSAGQRVTPATATIPAIPAIPATAARDTPHPNPLVAATPTPTVRSNQPTSSCARPAPASAAAYAAALAALPASQWGAADLSLSVPMPDGRSVWLYGDTLIGTDSLHLTGFVHSTAVVQDQGCFHVSRRGAQILPDDGPRTISWISAAVALDASHLLVATGQERITGTCGFCFVPIGTRGAVLTVDHAGDVRFDRWLPHWPTPRPVIWGAGLVRSGDSVVLFGVSPTGMARDLFVGTAPLAAVLAGRPGSWRLGRAPVATGVDPAGVSAWRDVSGLHLLTKQGQQLTRFDARTVGGPYRPVAVGTVPADPAGRLSYYAAAHPEARLRDGTMLVTVCRNWVDGARHPIAAYRPSYLTAAR